MLDKRDLLRVHARAFNARDLDTVVGQYTQAARVLRDGRWVGEGPEVLKDTLSDEYGWDGAFEQLSELDGEPVLLEWSGETNPQLRAVIHLDQEDGRITSCRIDHDEKIVRRAAEQAMDV